MQHDTDDQTARLVMCMQTNKKLLHPNKQGLNNIRKWLKESERKNVDPSQNALRLGAFVVQYVCGPSLRNNERGRVKGARHTTASLGSIGEIRLSSQ